MNNLKAIPLIPQEPFKTLIGALVRVEGKRHWHQLTTLQKRFLVAAYCRDELGPSELEEIIPEMCCLDKELPTQLINAFTNRMLTDELGERIVENVVELYRDVIDDDLASAAYIADHPHMVANFDTEKQLDDRDRAADMNKLNEKIT